VAWVCNPEIENKILKTPDFSGVFFITIKNKDGMNTQ